LGLYVSEVLVGETSPAFFQGGLFYESD